MLLAALVRAATIRLVAEAPDVGLIVAVARGQSRAVRAERDGLHVGSAVGAAGRVGQGGDPPGGGDIPEVGTAVRVAE